MTMNTPDRISPQVADLSTTLSGSPPAPRTPPRRRHWLWPLIAALLLGGLGWWVHHAVEEVLREDLAGQLTTILSADVEALRVWIKDQQAIARSLASLPALRPAARELSALADRPDTSPRALLEARAQAEVRALLGPFLDNFGYVDFFIVSPSMRIVATRHDLLLQSVLEGDRLDFAQQVLAGASKISKPLRATVLLRDAQGELKAGRPTMFVGAPILDEHDKPCAVLGLRLRPEAEFTEILRTARFGASGETYAFSNQGLLLSQSRFDSDLKRFGLLADLPDAQSILTVELRDPQVNMMAGERPTLARVDRPLTRLVARAIAGKDGVELNAYRDYRGVPSIGACHWLPEYGFGVATEVDVADAFRPLQVLRAAVWGLFALLVVSGGLILLFMRVVARQRRRMEQAEQTIKQLGQYTLEEKIGAGGMGEVYRARHAFLRRPTAIKMLNPENVSADALARFEREVQLTSRLNHPNTIAVYDYGRTPQGVFYYAMEYLEGIDLEKLVQHYGALPEGRVVPILAQICGSLAEAHAIGLIHRDIKPANIILTARVGIPDFVKVLDFGLVKSIHADAAAGLTSADMVLGTPHYLAPEAIEQPDTITALADIYAIGAVGYFLLTGAPVFSGKTILDVCLKQVQVPPEPPSRRLGRALASDLEAIILRCLAKNAAERPASALGLMDELARCETAPGWSRADAEAWWSAFAKPLTLSPDSASTVKA
jgi:hypothetical protein